MNILGFHLPYLSLCLRDPGQYSNPSLASDWPGSHCVSMQRLGHAGTLMAAADHTGIEPVVGQYSRCIVMLQMAGVPWMGGYGPSVGEYHVEALDSPSQCCMVYAEVFDLSLTDTHVASTVAIVVWERMSHWTAPSQLSMHDILEGLPTSVASV
ncbi:hypothetical protein KIPB_009378 [Kipferlia bialata]|uniref:Uncharacterized protein n=1 Tax=Kipferlia bialata TaxID=797122 RepID=A0A9K3GM26_9EUKA|nr:hypothetical protein KIPB_009378 [Kipferlia bialata]|eukprot:g9378.t1